MLLSEIRSWSVAALRSIAAELGDELRNIQAVVADLELISGLPGWNSPAADAARSRIAASTATVLDDAAVAGAVHQLAEETATAVTRLQSELDSVRADVAGQGGLLLLAENGDVSISAPAHLHDSLRPLADSVERRARALIHQADDIDADCAEVFGHLVNGYVTAGKATDFGTAQQNGREQSGLSAPYPPEGDGVEPHDVAAWWNALSEYEHRKVIAEHPDWIGNRDGVPVRARSEANIGALDRELARARAEVDALPDRAEFRRDHSGLNAAQSNAAYSRILHDRTARLENAEAMRAALADPDRYLMLLEFPDGSQPRAAVAVGDPDAAEYVAVLTPGMNSHPASLPAMSGEADVLRAEAERQLIWAGHPDQKAAVIAWLGYDPPDSGDLSVLEAGSQRRAEDAAPDLADLYRGINATNEHGSGVHLSAFGHSYGSLTTAQALHELGETGVVDAAAFYGSPGLGSTDATVGFGPTERAVPIRDEADLYLADGHAFVMSAPDDPVSGDPTLFGLELPALGDLNQLGPNPTGLPLEQLSSAGAVTSDGVARDGASGHSQYQRADAEGVLRTPGYNLAVIAAGLADDPRDLLIR